MLSPIHCDSSRFQVVKVDYEQLPEAVLYIMFHTCGVTNPQKTQHGVRKHEVVNTGQWGSKEVLSRCEHGAVIGH